MNVNVETRFKSLFQKHGQVKTKKGKLVFNAGSLDQIRDLEQLIMSFASVIEKIGTNKEMSSIQNMQSMINFLSEHLLTFQLSSKSLKLIVKIQNKIELCLAQKKWFILNHFKISKDSFTKHPNQAFIARTVE